MLSRRYSTFVLIALLLALPLAAQTPLNFPVYAGSPPSAGYEDGPGAGARFAFDFTSFIAVDASGNAYLTDPANRTIRRISAGGTVTTFAGLEGSIGNVDGTGGNARFTSPSGIAIDGGGNLYVADAGTNTIRKINPAGVVTTLAGTAGVAGSADGTGTAATFNQPFGVEVDSTGNIFVADGNNNTIRKITPAGVVTTLAGQVGICGAVDGTGAGASFCFPTGLAINPGNGDLFVSDYANAIIRKVTSAGVVTTLAGQLGVCGATDGFGAAAAFCAPWSIARDPAGILYVTDESNRNIRSINTATTAVNTLAGPNGALCSPYCPFGSANGTGTAARFGAPEDVAYNPITGGLMVTDIFNHDVRAITLPGAVVSRVAGVPGSVGYADGTGTGAQFNFRAGALSRDASFTYLADTSSHTIRKVAAGAVVTTLAGSGGVSGFTEGAGGAARFNSPFGIVADGFGNVFVADTFNQKIRFINSAGTVSTWAGPDAATCTANANVCPGGNVDANGTAARFRNPRALAIDGFGNLYVANRNGQTIRKIDSARNVTTLAGSNGLSGSADGTGAAARFSFPAGIAVDSAGNVFVADTGNRTIRKITPAGVVTTIAGSPGLAGSADGTGATARFTSPTNLSLDAAGNLLIADPGNSTLRKMTPAGVVTTIAGEALRVGGGEGTGLFARFFQPSSIITDASGNYLVMDAGNQAIRISSATGLNDLATIDQAIGSVGTPRQLSTNPNSAVSWQWKLIRQPTVSVATISSTTSRNPMFTPDVADYYTYRVTATNGANSATTEVSLRTALAPRILRDLVHQPALARPGEVVIFQIQDLSAPVQLFFSDGVNPTVAAAIIGADYGRGIVMARVPASGALTGNLRLTSAGVDALPYYFRVQGAVLATGADQVSGTVTKLAGGAPVAGAAVVLLSKASKCNNGGGDVRDATMTDAGGNYTLRGDPGAAQVFVFAPFAAAVANGGVNVTLAAAPVVAPIALAAGTTVTGTVLDAASGQPLPNASLNFDSNGNGGFEIGLSDAAGNFSFQRTPSVTANDENLEVHAPYKVARAYYRNSYTISSTSPQSLGAITLAQGVVISGAVTRALDGTPMSGADISAQPTNGGSDVDRSAVFGDGSYLLTVPANQNYRVQEQTNGTAPFVDQSVNSVAVATLPVTQNFALLEAGFITGIVTDSGTGLPISNLGIQGRLASSFNMVGSTNTCTDGTYSLRVAPGAANSVVVSTQNNSCTTCNPPPPPPYANLTYKSGGNTWFYCEGTPITIASAGSTVANINFNTPRAATITGSFYTQASGCVTADPAITNPPMQVDDGTTHFCNLGDTYNNTPPPAGTYQINALPPSALFLGAIRVCINSTGSYSPQCSYRQLSPAYTQVSVASTGTAVANFCLGNRPTTVVGGLLLGKGGANLNFNWNASPDLYHDHYRIYQASTARPAVGSGTFPGDPFSSFFDVFSGTSTSTPSGAATLFFLAVDTGITGTPGPSGSYGN